MFGHRLDCGESSPDLDKQVPADGEKRHVEFERGEYMSLSLLETQNNAATEEYQAVYAARSNEMICNVNVPKSAKTNI